MAAGYAGTLPSDRQSKRLLILKVKFEEDGLSAAAHSSGQRCWPIPRRRQRWPDEPLRHHASGLCDEADSALRGRCQVLKYLAFPNCQNSPPLAAEATCHHMVSHLVVAQLRHPVATIRSRLGRARARLMLMPKAAVDENNGAESHKHQIRSPNKLRVAYSVTKAQAVQLRRSRSSGFVLRSLIRRIFSDRVIMVPDPSLRYALRLVKTATPSGAIGTLASGADLATAPFLQGRPVSGNAAGSTIHNDLVRQGAAPVRRVSPAPRFRARVTP